MILKKLLKNIYKILISKLNKVGKRLPVLIKVSLLFTLIPLSSTLKSQNNDIQENNRNWILSPGFSVGFLTTRTFSNYPSTVSIYFNPPIGSNFSSFYFDFSVVYGNFNGQYTRPKWIDKITQTEVETKKFNVPFLMIGGDLPFINDFFTEFHLGLLGRGVGFRSFIGKDIPGFFPDYKLKIGSEFFLGNALAGPGNMSYVGTFFIRFDWFLNKIKFASSF